MKQHILYLLGIITIFHTTFPMTYKWGENIKPDYDKAQTFEKSGNLQEALKLYDKVMNSYLPEERPDPYTQERALQTQAIDQILQIAQTFQAGDLSEALAWYIKVADKHFYSPLSDQPDPYTKARKLQEQAIIKISQIAQIFENKNLNEALTLYIKIADKYFPSPLGQPDPYQAVHKIQEHAINKILQNAQTFEQNRKLDDVLKWYDNIISKYIPSPPENQPDPYQEMRKLQLQALTRIFQNAQTIEQNGNLEKALKWYGKIADTELPSPDRDRPDPYQEVRKLPEQAIKKISEEAQRLKSEKKYEESLKIYQFAPREFKEVITKLQGTIKALPDLRDAEQLAKNPSEENFKKAFTLLSKHKMVPEAKVLEMKIQQQERLWKQRQPQQTQVPVAPPKIEKKWLFIKNMPGAKNQEDPDADWRIKEQKLELNLNTTETMTQDSFANIIEQTRNLHLPFILVMAQSEDIIDPEKPKIPKKYIHFFDGSAINHFMTSVKLRRYFENPANRQMVIKAEIYVVGNDGKLYLLKDNANVNYLEQFVDYKGVTEVGGKQLYNYELKPALKTPREAQNFIANLYKKEAEKGGPEAEKFRQLERLWLNWAANPSQSIPLQEVTPSKPISPETEKQLIQTLYNFKQRLEQLISKLK